MKRYRIYLFGLIFLFAFGISCQPKQEAPTKKTYDSVIQRKLANYSKVELKADLSQLSSNQIKMISQLIKAANSIDELYWKQAYGDKKSLLDSIGDKDMLEFAKINYGPWDRLDGFKPFTEDFPPRPLGLRFYPTDINQEEFFQLPDDDKFSPFTILTRNNTGNLQVTPYHQAYRSDLETAVQSIKEAANLAESADFKNYLTQLSKDLLADDFTQSNQLWLQDSENTLDFIAGPIVNTEDHLLWTKYSYGAFILLKNKEWNKNAEKYAALLPFLLKNLPVGDHYKIESSEKEANIMIYDVLYNAGFCNAGSKLIALNLPIGDSKIRLNTRKIHFKNIMQAKFDQILKPISKLVIDEKQQRNVTFDAFFLNSIFHELANGINIQQTINGNGDVKEALKEHYNVISELKNDVLRMYMQNKVYDMRQLEDIHILDKYTTFMADIFRSVRFGVTDAQGVANMIRFYYFEEQGAFHYNRKSGTYKINSYKMKKAIESLTKMVLEIMGKGDYAAADQLIKDKGYIRNELLQVLYKIQREKVPIDLIYDQGEKSMIAEN